MKKTHPPTLLTMVLRTSRDEDLFARGDTVMVSISGGPDSMALLSVMAHWAPRLGIRVVAHGVDHGLRPEAAAELELAGELAAKLGVPFGTTSICVERGPNLMARARKARYEALRAALATATPSGARGLLATGHHADDRAETVLMRIMRGSGPRGLAVLPARAGDLVRPLIRARRSDILAHLQRHAIRYAEDPSNRDPHYLRSQVRHQLLPQMTQLSPGIVEHLCALADALGQPLETPSTLAGHPLGRAQRLLLERALRQGNSRVRVPVAGGKVVGLDLPTRQFVLMEED